MTVIALPRKRVWAQQPPTSPEPNHAIGRVRFLVAGYDRLRDAISGKVAEYGTNPYSYGVNKNGRQGLFNYAGAGTYTGVMLPANTPLIVTWTEQNNASSGYMGVANLGFGGTTPCAILRAFTDSGYSFSLGCLGTDSAKFGTIGPPVTNEVATYSAVFPDGLGSGSKASVVVFKNGVRHVPTGTSYFSTSALNDRIVLGGMQGYHYYGLLGNFSVIEGNSEVLARELSLNPFLAFAPRQATLFVPASVGGSTLLASASGAAQATGTASLAAQIALSAVGISTASGTATASGSSNIPLSAAGLAVSSGTANPSATITISAAGLAQAAGQAGLAAAVLLAGAGAAQASGNAALAAQLNALASGAAVAAGSANLSGGAPGDLAASGGGVATGQAALSVTVKVQAAGGAIAAGSANAAASSPGQVSAAGGAQSGGTATWTATISLTAAGFVQAMGAGVWAAAVPLSAFGSSSATGAATLAEVGAIVLVRAPAGSGPAIIWPAGSRPRSVSGSRPANTGGRRY